MKVYAEDGVFEAHLCEVSGSGFRLRTPVPVTVGRLLTVRFIFGGIAEAFTALARVVRTTVLEPWSEKEVALTFIDIAPSHRDRLVQRLGETS